MLTFFSSSVGYVEFKSEDAIPAALEMTGQKLLNIPIIVQLTEADKNRQPKNTGNGEGNSNPNAPPQTRLYVGNIHFSIDEGDFESIFDPFGEIEGFALQRDDSGRSRGFGFIQSVPVFPLVPSMLISHPDIPPSTLLERHRSV